MRRNGRILCTVLLVMVFLIPEAAYAFPPVTNNTLVSTLMDDNHQPNPPQITGPATGTINKIYGYNFLLTDPDGDNLTAILIEWGGTGIDNTTYICWTCGGGFQPNGTIFVQDHSWPTAGTYTIQAKVWDANENVSDWGTLSVTMPFSSNLPFHSFWERLFERFPTAFPLLRHLMGY